MAIRCSLNLGRTRRRRLVSTPKAPRPTLAAPKSCECSVSEQVTDVPFARIIVSSVIWLDMDERWNPVPCVPVWVAPATDCIAIAPVFSRAQPASSNAEFSWCTRIPACTWTVGGAEECAAGSGSARTRSRRSRLTSRDDEPAGRSSSVSVIGEKLWPAPTILIWHASLAAPQFPDKRGQLGDGRGLEERARGRVTDLALVPVPPRVGGPAVSPRGRENRHDRDRQGRRAPHLSLSLSQAHTI